MIFSLEDWATRPYAVALAAQRDLVARRVRGECGDTLVFVEHPPVFTLGRQGGRAHILVADDILHARGIEVIEVERGGDITYHGPGQLIAYPIFRLPEGRRNIKAFMRALEQAVARTCTDCGVPAKTIEGLTGVWVGEGTDHAPAWRDERKICSMGLAFRSWTSYHGLALNVNCDLTPFSFMHLCGLKGVQATSLAQERGTPIEMTVVKQSLARHINDTWGSFIHGNDRQKV